MSLLKKKQDFNDIFFLFNSYVRDIINGLFLVSAE